MLTEGVSHASLGYYIMNKKNITLVALGIIGSMAILIALYYNFSSNKADEKYLRNGGFERVRVGANMFLRREYGLEKGYYNIVGLIEGKVIVKKHQKQELIVFNRDHTKETIKIPEEIVSENIFDVLGHPAKNRLLYFVCNNDLSVFLFDIDKQKIVETFKFKHYFDKLLPATADSSFYVFRETGKESELVLSLVRFDKSGNDSVVKTSSIFKESMTDDGVFTKAGNNNLIYINFYNNRFSLIDTALINESFFKTIDTITTRPKTVTVRNNTIRKFAKAPRPVNQLVCVSNGLLFINSYASADNDIDNYPESTSDVFDIYDLKNDCKYKGSLYFGRPKVGRVQDFLVKDGTLVLQYPNKTLIYDFGL